MGLIGRRVPAHEGGRGGLGRTIDAATPNNPGTVATERKHGLAWSLFRLARPHQWVKGAFVLVGPMYGQAFRAPELGPPLLAALAAFAAFGFASSACYVFNDVKDAEADRLHPRKRRRPIASGAVSPGVGGVFAAALALLAGVALLGVYWSGVAQAGKAAGLTAACVGLYCVNVLAYSAFLKRVVIIDVMCLALGFVLRVLGGCAAVMVEPSSWLLNVTFFIAMFLAFGKRLGERRVMGEDVALVRGVQGEYTEALLRMLVVVTGVATLLTYGGYVLAQGEKYRLGFNLLWLTMLPATYGLLRCIVLLEKGTHDDPTELARKDRAFQLAASLFVLVTVVLMWHFRGHA
jgi:4-hydroxybenzoate polyprenyltransferase